MASGTSISHARVLVDWEQHALPKLLKLEKVMPGLVQRKVVPKKLSKGIVKKNDLQTLLGILKAKPIEVFVNFLQALADTFSECEAHRGLVLQMKDSLECIHIPPPPPPPPESDSRAAIQEVIARAEFKDQPTAPTPLPHPEPQPREELQSSGYIEPCRSWLFTQVGGSFRCPAHGIVGHIPASAVPPGIENFEVRMKVFMQGDFTFPADVEPCTAVVEFSLSPSFEFTEDITVKIPHCVVIDGKVDSQTFCLLKTSKKYAHKFEVLEARCSNHYHVIARLRHFCKVVGGCKIPLPRQRRWSRSDRTGISKRRPLSSTRECVKKMRDSPMLRDLVKQSSVTSSVSSSGSFGSSREDQGTGSVPRSPEIDSSMSSHHLTRQEAFDSGRNSLLVNQQSSSEDSSGYCYLYVLQCMPHQCTGGWKTHFLLSCALPTGIRALLQAGFGVETMRLCRPTESHLEFHPQHWNEDGWDVDATATPLIDTQEVIQFHEEQVESLVSAGLYPPRVSYLVNHRTDAHALNPVPLKCRIDVKGVEINGRPLYFMLTSPPQTFSTAKPSRRLHTCQDLYRPESAICSALSSGSDLPLDPRSEDHRRLIADISFQLTEKDLQCLIEREVLKPAIFDIHRFDLREQIYQVLLSWVLKLDSSITIRSLLSILETLGIKGIEVRSWSAESIEKRICSHFSKYSVQCNDKFLFDLAQEVQQHQSFIGRFIGMSEADISATIQDNAPESPSELFFQMFWNWQRRKGREATYGTLFMAICRVFEHDPSSVSSAWWLVTKESSKLPAPVI